MTGTPAAPLVAILGPTASGKSALAIRLAQEFAGEVVSCDSAQLYRGFDIGTAKVPPAEQQGIPHHLLSVLDPRQDSTAGGYRDLAEAVLNDLHARRRLPIFTVGTGLYLRALLEGLAELPLRSELLRDRLRASASAHSEGHLHRILRRIDPATAAKIMPGDVQKLIRAVEVCLLTKKPISQLHDAGRRPLSGWRPIRIALDPPREAHIERIHARTDAMLQLGWLAEVQRLDSDPATRDSKPFEFIGYRELRQVVRGQLTLAAAREAIQIATRQYAKRQRTWFRREPNVLWFPNFGDDPAAQLAIITQLRAALPNAPQDSPSPSISV